MDSIIEALADYFSPTFKENLKRCENLEKMITKLETKEHCIEQKLITELVDTERETLTIKLAVLKVQKDKAENLLKSSQEK